MKWLTPIVCGVFTQNKVSVLVGSVVVRIALSTKMVIAQHIRKFKGQIWLRMRSLTMIMN